METIEQVPQKLWDDIAAHCPYATFFHTYAWTDAFQKAYPEFKNATKALHFDGDDWVVLPVMETGSELGGFFKHYKSCEPGVYGGPIFNHNIDVLKLQAALDGVSSARTADLVVFGNPFYDWAPYLEGFEKRTNVTHLLYLGEFQNVEDISKRYERGTKKGIRTAEQCGVQFGVMENMEQVKEYYEAYEKVIAEWGSKATSFYKFELFQELFKKMNDGVSFWYAKYMGKMIGGAVTCRFNQHLDVWHAAWLPIAHEIGAGKYVYQHIIEHAFQTGIKFFDFNPSGGHKGTEKFKESMGCVRKEFSDYVYKHGLLWEFYSKLRPSHDHPDQHLSAA